jgi:hypothetical protein
LALTVIDKAGGLAVNSTPAMTARGDQDLDRGAHQAREAGMTGGEAPMLDTTPVTTAITKLISTGTTEQAILAAVAHLFPELTSAELSQALQVATAAAEHKVVAAKH